MITKLPNKTAKETKYALEKAIEEYGESQVKSITFDNRTENVEHTKFKQAYKFMENINKLIRQYFPRWSKMNKATDAEIYKVQEKLNNRPKKIS